VTLNRKNPFFLWMDQFLYSPAYFLFLGVLTILANVFCLEAYAYTVLIATGIYVCLFGRDLLPIFPIFACGYISPSYGNNPGFNEHSIFSMSGGGWYLALILTTMIGCLIWRLVKDPVFGGKKFLTKKRTLLPGMLILCLTYVISGAGSGQWAEYGLRNLLFSFIQLVAIAGLYYLLSGSVLWDQAPKDYLFWTGLCVGYVLTAELMGIYLTQGVLNNGTIVREKIVTGWGHYNSMGALLAMIIPLPFFLTGKEHQGIFAYITSYVFLGALLLTCSRGSILFGAAVYGLAYLLSLVCSRNARRCIGVHVATVVLAVVFFILSYDKLMAMLDGLLKSDSSIERMDIYSEGIKQFLKFPVFGGTFYPVDYWPYAWASAESFTTMFPPRWHNTIIQLLATGGVVCLVGYFIHRFQTIRLFLKNLSAEKVFAGLAVLSLLMTSMVDCHFFNVGPVLFYSGLLAFVEFQFDKTKKLR